MDRNGVMQTLQAEATRRFSGQPASNVGMKANPSASQPATPRPQQAPNMMQMQSPTMPTSSDPFGGGAAAMNGSVPMTGGTKLESALIKRMNLYPPA